MFTILDRHIGRSILVATAVVLGVLAALFVFVAFVDGLSDFGKGTFGLYELLRYIVLSQPRRLYEVFPVAVLIGTLLGLSVLAFNAELTAMRAAGVSKARIVVAAMKTGLLFVVIALLLGEYLVPGAETEAQTGRARALEAGAQQQSSGLWLRDGSTFVNLGEVLPDLSLLRVQIFEFAADLQLKRETYAERAVYQAGRWRLEGVRASDISPDQVTPTAAPERAWMPRLTPELVAVFTIKPEALSITQLVAYVRHLQQNGQETARYSLTLWQKILMPVATAVMVLLATPFIFRPVRSGGMAQRLFVGVLIGLAFTVFNRAGGYVGLIYGVSPLASAVAPVLLFLTIAVVLLRRSG